MRRPTNPVVTVAPVRTLESLAGPQAPMEFPSPQFPLLQGCLRRRGLPEGRGGPPAAQLSLGQTGETGTRAPPLGQQALVLAALWLETRMVPGQALERHWSKVQGEVAVVAA